MRAERVLEITPAFSQAAGARGVTYSARQRVEQFERHLTHDAAQSAAPAPVRAISNGARDPKLWPATSNRSAGFAAPPTETTGGGGEPQRQQ